MTVAWAIAQYFKIFMSLNCSGRPEGYNAIEMPGIFASVSG